jgi:hypothetical protein
MTEEGFPFSSNKNDNLGNEEFRVFDTDQDPWENRLFFVYFWAEDGKTEARERRRGNRAFP